MYSKPVSISSLIFSELLAALACAIKNL